MAYLDEDILSDVSDKIITTSIKILGLEGNTSSHYLLEHYSHSAQDFIFDFCKLNEIPPSLYTVITEMIVFQYKQKGVENVASEGKGSVSESYLTEYPPNIMNRLKSHRKIVIL
ncbi:phage head-tail connector protein [Mesobacillus sp. S13]|uniref:phage head-tail connector protein n=1 Tax=Mesobacillus sp. S13 TaxID=2880221 RepID=UPI001CF1CFE8|nr:phage head-tail connector protein [Mesobacillus sp. S13]